MAGKTKKRLRRAAKKLERQRRAALAARNPARPKGRTTIGPDDLFPPGWPDDPEGGAGVREPRRPFPTTPAGAIALDEPTPAYLDLVG